MPEGRYQIRASARARRDIERIPEPAAWACLEFIAGSLSANPHRLGKALKAPFLGLHAARRGTYRVIYRIDDDNRVLEIVHIDHRAQAYRP